MFLHYILAPTRECLRSSHVFVLSLCSVIMVATQSNRNQNSHECTQNCTPHTMQWSNGSLLSCCVWLFWEKTMKLHVLSCNLWWLDSIVDTRQSQMFMQATQHLFFSISFSKDLIWTKHLYYDIAWQLISSYSLSVNCDAYIVGQLCKTLQHRLWRDN